MPMPAQRRTRKGNLATIVALSSVVLLSFAALTLDLGYGRLVKQQLENASEAAARAGSLQLDGTEEGLTAARATAVSIAAANLAGGASVALAEEDILLGVWDATAGTFTESDDPVLVDTVEVRAHIDDLAMFLSPAAFSRETVEVAGSTRAMIKREGASASRCYIPLALPDCVIERDGVDGIMDLTLKLNPAGVDNVGWGRANGTPNASWTKSQIADCESGGEAEVGDPVGLQNGTVTTGIKELADAINASETLWDPAKWGTLPARMSQSLVTATNYGRTFEGPIMVFDGGPDYCTGSGGSFNESLPLKGFLWAAVYDAKTAGGAAEKNINLRVDTSEYYDFGTSGGGEDYGVIYTAAVMVRND